MTFYLATPSKTSMLNTLVTAAGTTSTIIIYSGTVPVNADAALSGNTALVTLPCSATIGTVTSNVFTANAISQVNSVATGTATFYRLLASNGTTVLAQGAVGTSGAELNLNATAVTSGGPVIVSSYTVSM